MRFRHVLVVDDGGGMQLLRCAAILAGTSGGHIRLVSRADAATDPSARVEAAVQERLHRRATLLRSRGVHVTTGVITRGGWEGIVREARRARAEIVLKARERTTRTGIWPRGDGDRLLLRRCPCPVWLIDDESAPDGPIIAAIDPREHWAALNTSILEAAVAVADGLRTSVHVVYAWSASLMPMLGRVAVDPQRNASAIAEGVETALADVKRCTARLSVSPERIYLVRAEPRVALPAVAASAHAQVLVMGERRGDGLAEVALRSGAEHILRGLRCSLLVLRAAPTSTTSRASARIVVRRLGLAPSRR
jgi:nucleotide-binding universal stress UspA family protein